MVVRTFGCVVLADGQGHRCRLALYCRVMPAHDALQLRELAHHAGDEIGLGQQCGPFGQHAVRAGNMGHERAGQRHQPLDPLALRAELGVEHHACKTRQPAFQGALAVLVPEELGVPEARAQDALVAGDDRRPAVARLQVGHQDELPRQRAVRRMQRQVFLVRAHGGHQRLGRHRHECLVDGGHERHGPLDQTLDLVEQGRIVGEFEVLSRGQLLSTARDDGTALRAVENHLGRAQLDHIVGEVVDRERSGRHEAVAAGAVRGGDAADRELHDPTVQQAQDRVQRPDPAKIAIAPAHRLGPGQPADHRRQQLAEQGTHRPALLAHQREQGPGFLVRPFLERVVEPAEPTQEARARLLGGIGARTFALDDAVGLLQRQSGHHDGEPAGGRERPDRLVESEIGRCQRFGHAARQILARPVLHPGRDFFRDQLQEQLSHGRDDREHAARPRRRPWPGHARVRCRRPARSR